MSYRFLKAAILDWAGTAVDFGSLAPVAALQSVFAANGVAVTTAEVRAHMGLLKKDHIRAICRGERVAEAWRARYGQPPAESDIDCMFREFLPRQAEILGQFSAPVPGAAEAVDAWRARGLRIGSTTGYTRALMDVVMPAAAAHGYAPDACVTPDEVGAGRPAPFMCFQNATLLGVYPLWHCVKIGDTPSDIAEGLNAGMWTIGVTASGNETGLALEEWESLPPDVQAARERDAARRLRDAGAHYTARWLGECTVLLEEIDRRIAAGERP